MNNLRDVSNNWHSRAVVASLLVVMVLLIASRTRAALVVRDQEGMIRTASKIGEIVEHSTRTIFLAPYYGKPLQYYGELSGAYWPRKNIYWKYRRLGEQDLSVRERLAKIGFIPQYFIITDFSEFNKHHSDLKEFLANSCHLVTEKNNFLIYKACDRMIPKD